MICSPRKAFLACGLLAGFAGLRGAAAAPPAVAFDRSQTGFLQAHCLKCHGEKAEEGIPRLDTIPYELATVEAAERWQRVLAVMNSGEMPPADEPQPPAAAKTEFLAALSATLVQARKSLGDQGRVGLLRRLNRREYVNTIEDLLGVETEAEALPDDKGAGAFDTVGSSLTMSSDQVENYLALGRKVVATAFADMRSAEHPPEKKLVHRETELEYHHTLSLAVRDNMRVLGKIRQWEVAGRKEDGVKQLSLPGAVDAKGVDAQRLAITQGGHFLANCLALPRAVEGSYLVSCAYPGHFPFRSNEPIVIPPEAPAGDYVLRVRLGTSDDPRSEPRRFVELAYLEDGDRYKPRAIAVREVTNHFKSPAVIEFPVHLTPGSQRHFVIREKRFSSCDLQYFLFHRELNKGNGVGPAPTIWIDWVEWEGPTFDPAITDRRLRLLGSADPTRDDAAARDVLTRFATRAFRGVEPTPAFIDRLMAVRQRKRPAQGDFLDSLVEPMAIILASPGFLYLNEPLAPAATAAADRALSDIELASRLSYLLWAGPPDDQLLAAAAAGDLRKPAGLAAQVDRLVADPKSLRFATGFAHQWLTLDRLDFFQFDWKNYPRFDQATQTASKQEIYETIHHLLRENVDARALLKSDFVVINDLMASYYGIDDGGRPVLGPHFRRVNLPADSPRGGLIATACILAMGSNGSSTSPVERGAWVMRKLLNDPPPPAPANVPQLSRLDGKKFTARERLLAHQEQAQCAQCHRRIDPIGFGLENFDAAGLWREVDSYKPGVYLERGPDGAILVDTYPIDATGVLPGGPSFRNYFELRDLIATRGDDFLRGLVENLYEYALGRPVSFADAEAIDGIVAATKARGGGFRTIVQQLVASPEFQTK